MDELPTRRVKKPQDHGTLCSLVQISGRDFQISGQHRGESTSRGGGSDDAFIFVRRRFDSSSSLNNTFPSRADRSRVTEDYRDRWTRNRSKAIAARIPRYPWEIDEYIRSLSTARRSSGRRLRIYNQLYSRRSRIFSNPTRTHRRFARTVIGEKAPRLAYRGG